MRVNFRIWIIVLAFILLGACNGVRVRKGDTLYSISKRHDVPMRAIIEENDLKPPYILSIGQYLVLPRQKTYRVRTGDTLYSIATRHGMTVSSLAKINNISAPYTIHRGDVLKISSWAEEEKQVASAPSPSVAKPIATGSVVADRQAEINQRKNVKNPTAFKGKANVPKAQAGKRFAWPVSGKVVSPFGSNNDGINIAGKAGTPVKAADGGTVAYAGNELKGYGNLVLIKHKDGWITAYAHNRKLLVKKGAIVKKGQQIAEMGSTGGVKTPQLHFEIRYKAKVVNPNQYLP
ncbi:MAG: peptidoglycan DD-metalloendopeptidase family protein [Alphaproteobacteria bacterium]|nr:peptidoglycan DD-metalloendopeptidase family protein [Alphaproteobacteria bacterium]